MEYKLIFRLSTRDCDNQLFFNSKEDRSNFIKEKLKEDSFADSLLFLQKIDINEKGESV